MNRLRGQSGQASSEMIAGAPAIVLGALIALQLLVTAYTYHLADGAAEAGALALAAGREPGAAARGALPAWAADRVRVSRDGDEIEVSVLPPAPARILSEALEVSSSAWVKPGDEWFSQ